MKNLIIFILFVDLINPQSLTTFPNHDPKDDIMINPEFDPRDKPACGLFKQPPTASGRVSKGEESYIGQFPWTVCIIKPIGYYIVTNTARQTEYLYTVLPDINIFKHGPYEFSYEKGNVLIDEVKEWKQFCTGSIIDEHWVLTAAHCFRQSWEGMFFYVNAGTTECLNNQTNEELIKLVVVNRLSKELQTIFEHETYIKSRTSSFGHDVALIRINDGYILPVDTYNNEAINRVCLYSFFNLPKDGCLKNVYFSGFGKKSKDDLNDLTSKLTWFKLSRINDDYCLIHTNMKNNPKYEDVWCLTSISKYADLNENSSKIEGAIKDRDEAFNYPDNCPGDSGGPFVYYMKYDKPETSPSITSGYRALQISSLKGSNWRQRDPTWQRVCGEAVYEGQDMFLNMFYIPKTVYYKPITVACKLWTKIERKTWMEVVFTMTHTGHPVVEGNFVKYPSTSTVIN